MGNSEETRVKHTGSSKSGGNAKYQLSIDIVNTDNKQTQKMKTGTRAHLCKPPNYHQKIQKRYSAGKEKTRKLLTGGYSHSFISDQETLQITLIQCQLLEKEDHLSSNKCNPSRLSERDHGRKQKIYETYEFIDYLLNHYYCQTPKYASVCLEPSHTTSTHQWQRSVCAKGNGFQINLRNCKCHSTRLSQMQNLESREQVQEDDYRTKICTQCPVHKSQKRGKVTFTKECTKEFKYHCKDTANEIGDQLTPVDGKGYLLEKTHAYQVKDSKSRSQSQVSSPNRSAGLELELKDFLEDISSDSDCFSETLSINQEEKEKSVVTYESFPEKGSLDADKIITCNQEIRSSQQTLYSKWKYHGEEKYSKYQLRKPGNRSEYELRSSWFKGKNNFMSSEKCNRKKREILAPKYLFGKGYYHKSSSSDLLGHITRRRRRISDYIFDQKVNYRPSHVPITSSKCANAFYFGDFPQQKRDSVEVRIKPDSRRFKRHENYTDFMLTSGNYIRHNSQEHMDYRSYFRNSYTTSLYF